MSPKLILIGQLLLIWLVPMAAYAQSGGSAGSNRPVDNNKVPDIKSMPEFFDYYCVRCHGGTKSEGNLTLQDLALVPAESWHRIGEVIESAEMPPESESQPRASLKNAALVWISKKLQQVTPAKPRLRRMSRFEYEKTVQDLLGIDIPLADFLPEESESAGFDNVADGLSISSVLLERYLDAANAAFEATIKRVKPSEPTVRRSVLSELEINQKLAERVNGNLTIEDGAVVDFSDRWPLARADTAHPAESGLYRCRIAAWPHDPGERTLAVGVFTGSMSRTGQRNFQGLFDVVGSPSTPKIIEFTAYIEAEHGLHIIPWIFPKHVAYRDKGKPAPGVAIAWAETYGPLDQEFPSLASVALFGTSPTLSLKTGERIFMRHRKEVLSHSYVSSDPEADIERILGQFIPRAFRRPVTNEQIGPFVKLAKTRFMQGSTFEQAVQAGVTAVLCSPNFLMLNLNAEDDYFLASRLSYFLWSSMPDEELLQAAAEGRLRDPAQRHAQVERMLGDAKAEQFVEHFTDQWLDLSEIEFTNPDETLYPEYDELLLHSMLQETRSFFRHVLQKDLSVNSFIHSDFTIVNQRLAEHYEIPGVVGHEEFKIVTLPADHVRGGVLSQASVLKVTANGTNTSPIIRGAWILERILGQPSPPPPAGVPAVEPDIRGATTIREQLIKHQEIEDCGRCHRRIDPHGWALEEFDVLGKHRTQYRVTEGNRKARVANARYYRGPKVDSSGTLPNNSRFDGFVEYRRQLAGDSENLARAMATKLLIYACGRPVDFQDRAIVDQILQTTNANRHGLRSMIHAVTDSEMFLKR